MLSSEADWTALQAIAWHIGVILIFPPPSVKKSNHWKQSRPLLIDSQAKIQPGELQTGRRMSR